MGILYKIALQLPLAPDWAFDNATLADNPHYQIHDYIENEDIWIFSDINGNLSRTKSCIGC